MHKQILAYLTLVVVMVGLFGCAGADKKPDPLTSLKSAPPAVEYDRLAVPTIDLEHVVLEHYFKVTNAANVPLAVTKVKYHYEFMGKVLADTEMPLNLSVEPGKVGEFAVTQDVVFPESYEDIKAMLEKKDGAFILRGEVVTAAGTFPINVEGDIKLPTLLEVKVENCATTMDSADQLTFTFNIVLANDNPFKVYAAYFDYVLKVEGVEIKKDKWMVADKVVNPGFVFSVSTPLTPDNIGKDMIKKILTASALNYEVSGTLKTSKFEMPVNLTGTLKFIR